MIQVHNLSVDYTGYSKRRRSSNRLSGLVNNDNSVQEKVIKRYYYRDIEIFKNVLKLYNNGLLPRTTNSHCEVSGKRCFKCVGYVNRRLRLCSLCFDINKEADDNKEELYFIDCKQISKERTVLCFGCLGGILYTLKSTENMHLKPYNPKGKVAFL